MKRGAPLKRNKPLRTSREKRTGRRDTGPDRTTRDKVLERDSGCLICGAGPYGLQVHHRKPRRMGGRKVPGINSPANLISLCPTDHAWVESSRAEALEMGLLVSEHDDPAQVPVTHRDYGSVFLTDDGDYRLSPEWGGVA